MSRLTLSRRDRRALIGGGATILVLLALSRGVPAWRAWQSDARGSAAELTAEAARARASVASLPAMRDSVAARRERLLTLHPALLSGETPAGAAAALTTRLSLAAAAAEVRLGSVQVRTDSLPSRLFNRVQARAGVTGDVRGVVQLLLALERGPLLLGVRELTISQPEPAAPSDRPEMLRVDLLVEGLAVPGREGRRRE